MGEVQSIDQLQVTLLSGRKVIVNKIITLDLIVKNIIFIQQFFVIPITSPIILGSNF